MDTKINILMVDDHPGKLLTYETMLGELDENLIKVHSGMEALEHLLKTDVALVLMDVSMPGMDGFETAKMIHEHPRFQDTPIGFISGILVSDMDRLRGYQHGAVDYVSVPVVPELLRAKVRVFVELHRKTQQLEALNARMTTLQDEERGRIARELHDSVGQLLAAVSMNSAVVEAESHKLSPEAAKRVHQNASMVEEATKEIRTISHLLHPPFWMKQVSRVRFATMSRDSPNGAISQRTWTSLRALQACLKKWNSASFAWCRNALPISIVMPRVPRQKFALRKTRRLFESLDRRCGQRDSTRKEVCVRIVGSYWSRGARNAREALTPIRRRSASPIKRVRDKGGCSLTHSTNHNHAPAGCRSR